MNPLAQTLAFIEGVGGPELLMVMFVVLLLFGGQKLPELAKGMGKAMREFKKAANGVEEEFKRALEDTTAAVTDQPKPALPPAADEAEPAVSHEPRDLPPPPRPGA